MKRRMCNRFAKLVRMKFPVGIDATDIQRTKWLVELSPVSCGKNVVRHGVGPGALC